MESDQQKKGDRLMFVRLTMYESENPVYVNANTVLSVEDCGKSAWIIDAGRHSDSIGCEVEGYMVKESAETVVMLLESALKGGFVK